MAKGDITHETVSRVIDGDTFETAERRESIRLEDVYAPESHEPGGAAATTKLKALIDGKVVRIEDKGYDDYGRLLAQVQVNGVSVNDAMQG